MLQGARHISDGTCTVAEGGIMIETTNIKPIAE